MSQTRLGLIGYGAIAQKHIEVFRALGVEIVAACNRSAANRQRAEQEAGIPRTYADANAMLDGERLDGLLVTVKALALFDVAVQVIPRGLPMLIEKPPGVSVAETLELDRLAHAARTQVMVGLNRRFYSVYHRALPLLGGRNAVTRVSVEWSEDPSAMLAKGHPPALTPVLNFANSLHGIDLLTFWAGPVQPHCVWGRNLDPSGAAWRWQMSLTGIGETGASAHFNSTWDAPGHWRMVVDARDARMVCAPLEAATILRRGSSATQIEPDLEDRRFKPGFHLQATRFLAVIGGETGVEWPSCSLETAAASMRLAEALTAACRLGS